MTQSLWVQAQAGDERGFGEGCPREYVTSESLESAHAFVGRHAQELLHEIEDVATLSGWVRRHAAEIDANPAAWTAVETAVLDLLGRTEKRSVESLLAVPELAGRFRYTAVIGDADEAGFEAQLARYLNSGFCDFKIKLSGHHERNAAKVRALAQSRIAPRSVRADANNLWHSGPDAIRALQALEYPFLAIEEPLRAGDWAGMEHVAASLDTRIVLDKSLTQSSQLAQAAANPAAWIVNLRVSKMGGVMRSLELVREARRHGLRLIVGAHVGETSVLTRAALTVASGARDVLVAQEGAFGTHLLARDVANPTLMFGAGGVLEAADVRTRVGGWGLAINVQEADLRPL